MGKLCTFTHNGHVGSVNPEHVAGVQQDANVTRIKLVGGGEVLADQGHDEVVAKLGHEADAPPAAKADKKKKK